MVSSPEGQQSSVELGFEDRILEGQVLTRKEDP